MSFNIQLQFLLNSPLIGEVSKRPKRENDLGLNLEVTGLCLKCVRLVL